MAIFIPAIFLSAFLLFQVQPIIARYILPWYGGSPAVWTTCMLFFQIGLLVGYTYAHLLVSKFRHRPRMQAGIHFALLALSLLLLPITPSESLRPTEAGTNPIGGILHLLFLTVGLPYVAISASGPLLQHWFGSVAQGRSPYRLYAISNLGSLLGLLSYPILFEPNFRLGQQTSLWSGAYLVYALLASLCAWHFIKAPATQSNGTIPTQTPPRPTNIHRFLWVALAACGSLLLLSITSQMCQDVAVVPFLWVLPLSLYLITFIISFDHARWYARPFWIPLALLSITTLIVFLNLHHSTFDFHRDLHIGLQIALYSILMFSACMVCHGEMVRLKPHPHYLTSFYLAVSAGGALGGLFVSLAAPRLFNGYWEFHLGIITFLLLAGFCLFLSKPTTPLGRKLTKIGAGIWIAILVSSTWFLQRHIDTIGKDSIASTRGFYGVLNVYEDYEGFENHFRSLHHGGITHGTQFMHELYRHEPYTYYGPNSGPGILFRYHPRRSMFELGPMHTGVIGLGIGTQAAFATAADSIRFYEINPQVEEFARSHFTYLDDCAGKASVVLGDARIVLEQELATTGSQQFDILFIDAFSGDSIPIHLLTREAFQVYFNHLKPNGVLAVHITNLHLDLSDPVRTLAREFERETLLIVNDPDKWEENFSRWVLITKDKPLLDAIRKDGWHTEWRFFEPRHVLWTDDYSNLLEVIDWD